VGKGPLNGGIYKTMMNLGYVLKSVGKLFSRKIKTWSVYKQCHGRKY